LTAIDGDVLAGYCYAVAQVQALTADIAERGATIETQSGYQTPRPEVAMLNHAFDSLRKFGAELGIGAASRSKIDVRPPDDEENPLDQIIAGAARRR
jgi:P27 family predicted phage terminase small subunit